MRIYDRSSAIAHVLKDILHERLWNRRELPASLRGHGLSEQTIPSDIQKCFLPFGETSPRQAARHLVLYYREHLSDNDRRVAFGYLVPNVSAFIRWCFPLMALIRQLTLDGGSVPFKIWVEDNIPVAKMRWVLIFFFLYDRTGGHFSDLITEEYFTSDKERVSPWVSALAKTGLKDEWSYYIERITEVPALRDLLLSRPELSEDQELNSAVQPSWALAPVGVDGLKVQTHRLVLTRQETVDLWELFKRSYRPNDRRLVNPLSRLSERFFYELVAAGFLGYEKGEGGKIQSALVIEERWRTSAIDLVSDIRTESGGEVQRFIRHPWWPPRYIGGMHWQLRLEVLARTAKRQLDEGKKTETSIVSVLDWKGYRGSLNAQERNAQRRYELITQVLVTPTEAELLVKIFRSDPNRGRFNDPVTKLGPRLAQALEERGYFTVVDQVAILNTPKFEASGFVLVQPCEDLPHRFQSQRGGVAGMPAMTDKHWFSRLEQAAKRAKKARGKETAADSRQLLNERIFYLTSREAVGLSSLIDLAPFTDEEVVETLGHELLEVLTAYGYLRNDGLLSGFRFKVTDFRVGLNAGDTRRMVDISDQGIAHAEHWWIENLRSQIKRR